jgi:hypothetical protein
VTAAAGTHCERASCALKSAFAPCWRLFRATFTSAKNVSLWLTFEGGESAVRRAMPTRGGAVEIATSHASSACRARGREGSERAGPCRR